MNSACMDGSVMQPVPSIIFVADETTNVDLL